MLNSKLRIYSLGIIAEHKALDSSIVKVTPIEHVPMVDGEIRSNETKLESKGLTGDGVEYSVVVKIDSTIDAEWFSLETNRRLPPDVRRGEQVLIWQFGDTDKFYWSSMGRDDHLRRLETVVYAWSDESDPAKDIELVADNTYSLEVSTHKKLVTFRTCKNDGEDFLYTIQVDAKNSKVIVTDDNDNYFVLDSANTKLHLHNADGTDVALDKKDITFYAPKDVKGLADNDISIEAGNDFKLKVGNNCDLNVANIFSNSCATYTLSASASISCDTVSYTMDSPISTFTGNVAVGGGLAVAGGGGGGGPACSVSGDTQVIGTMSVDGGLNVTGTVNAGNFVAPGGAWHDP